MGAKTVLQLERYVLDAQGNARLEADTDAWCAWIQKHDTPLVETVVASGVVVTTRFTGMDMSCAGAGAPVLWETIIFGGRHNLHQQRYTSEAEALKGHERAVALAKVESD